MSDVDCTKELPTVLSLCTGYGGIERGLELAGYQHRTIAHVEIEAFAAANLVAKMEEGKLVPSPVWSDLKTLPAHCFRDRVDVLTGGYPCQPFSAAGLRKGTEDPRHLWPYIYDHVRTIRPVRCFFENVEGHISLGLRQVIDDLEGLGYATTWGIFSASEVGAPHQRKRVYILAQLQHPNTNRGDGGAQSEREHQWAQESDRSGAGQMESFVADASSAGRQQVTRGSYEDEAAHEGRASTQTHISAGDGEGRGAGAMAYTNSAGQQPSEWQPRSPEARHNAGRGSKAMANADSQRQRGRAETAGWQAGQGTEGSAGTNVADTTGNDARAIIRDLESEDGKKNRSQVEEQKDSRQLGDCGSDVPDANKQRLAIREGVGEYSQSELKAFERADSEERRSAWATEPNVGRVVNGAAFRVDRLRLLGNGVVPHTAAKAWIVLNDQLANEIA
tara:strand:+ start:129 stop:1469 length:1341 start_codon:yes stop_codon:yes gene_type:complete